MFYLLLIIIVLKRDNQHLLPSELTLKKTTELNCQNSSRLVGYVTIMHICVYALSLYMLVD